MDSRMKEVISLCVQVLLWSASVIINAPPGWFSAANWIISQTFHILFHSVCVFAAVSDVVTNAQLVPCVVLLILNHRRVFPGAAISVLIAELQWDSFPLLRRMTSCVQDSWKYLHKIGQDEIMLFSSLNPPIFFPILDNYVQRRAGNSRKISVLIFY